MTMTAERPNETVYSSVRCPVPGCEFRYAKSIVGWHHHIAKVSNHPNWATDRDTTSDVVGRFKHDFPDFFMYRGSRQDGRQLSMFRKQLQELLNTMKP
jgi:hypothetical protein